MEHKKFFGTNKIVENFISNKDIAGAFLKQENKIWKI